MSRFSWISPEPTSIAISWLLSATTYNSPSKCTIELGIRRLNSAGEYSTTQSGVRARGRASLALQ